MLNDKLVRSIIQNDMGNIDSRVSKTRNNYVPNAAQLYASDSDTLRSKLNTKTQLAGAAVSMSPILVKQYQSQLGDLIGKHVASSLQGPLQGVVDALSGTTGAMIQAIRPSTAKRIEESKAIRSSQDDRGFTKNAIMGIGSTSGNIKRFLMSANAINSLMMGGSPLNTISNPLMMGLAATQVLGSFMKTSAIKKLNATRKAPGQTEKAYVGNLDASLNLLISQKQIGPADQIKIAYLKGTTALLAAIHDQLEYNSDEKHKNPENVDRNFDELIYGHLKYKNPILKGINNLEDIVNKLILKYDPVTQLVNFFVGGKTPHQALEELASLKDLSKKDKEELRSEARSKGISVSDSRLMGSDISSLISRGSYEERMFSIGMIQTHLLKLIASESITMRKTMVDDNIFKEEDDREPGLFGKMFGGIKDTISNIPGLNAIGNIVSMPFKISGMINDSIRSTVDGLQRMLLGEDFRKFQDQDTLNQTLGYKKNNVEKANEFISSGLPNKLEEQRVLMSELVQIAEQSFKAQLVHYKIQDGNKSHNLYSKFNAYDATKRNNVNEVWDELSTKYMSPEEMDKAENTRSQHREDTRANAFMFSPLGRMMWIFDQISGKNRSDRGRVKSFHKFYNEMAQMGITGDDYVLGPEMEEYYTGMAKANRMPNKKAFNLYSRKEADQEKRRELMLSGRLKEGSISVGSGLSGAILGGLIGSPLGGVGSLATILSGMGIGGLTFAGHQMQEYKEDINARKRQFGKYAFSETIKNALIEAKEQRSKTSPIISSLSGLEDDLFTTSPHNPTPHNPTPNIPRTPPHSPMPGASSALTIEDGRRLFPVNDDHPIPVRIVNNTEAAAKGFKGIVKLGTHPRPSNLDNGQLIRVGEQGEELLHIKPGHKGVDFNIYDHNTSNNIKKKTRIKYKAANGASGSILHNVRDLLGIKHYDDDNKPGKRTASLLRSIGGSGIGLGLGIFTGNPLSMMTGMGLSTYAGHSLGNRTDKELQYQKELFLKNEEGKQKKDPNYIPQEWFGDKSKIQNHKRLGMLAGGIGGTLGTLLMGPLGGLLGASLGLAGSKIYGILKTKRYSKLTKEQKEKEDRLLLFNEVKKRNERKKKSFDQLKTRGHKIQRISDMVYDDWIINDFVNQKKDNKRFSTSGLLTGLKYGITSFTGAKLGLLLGGGLLKGLGLFGLHGIGGLGSMLLGMGPLLPLLLAGGIGTLAYKWYKKNQSKTLQQNRKTFKKDLITRIIAGDNVSDIFGDNFTHGVKDGKYSNEQIKAMYDMALNVEQKREQKIFEYKAAKSTRQMHNQVHSDIFREKGGPVEKGKPYIVGEKRPEVFVPHENGQIIPNIQGTYTKLLNDHNVSNNPQLDMILTVLKGISGQIDNMQKAPIFGPLNKIGRLPLALFALADNGFDIVKSIFKSIGTSIKGIVPSWFPPDKEQVSKFLSKFKNINFSWFPFDKHFFKHIFNKVKDFKPSWFTISKEYIKDFIKNIKFPKIMSFLPDMKDIKDWIKNIKLPNMSFLPNMKDIKEWFKNIKLFPDINWKKIKEFLSDYLGSPLKSFGNSLANLGKYLASKELRESIKSGFSSIGGWFGNMGSKIGSIAGKVGSGIKGVYGDMKSGVKTVYKDIKDAVSFKGLRENFKKYFGLEDPEKDIKKREFNSAESFYSDNIYWLERIHTRLDRLPKRGPLRATAHLAMGAGLITADITKAIFGRKKKDTSLSGKLDDIKNKKKSATDDEFKAHMMFAADRIVQVMGDVEKDNKKKSKDKSSGIVGMISDLASGVAKFAAGILPVLGTIGAVLSPIISIITGGDAGLVGTGTLIGKVIGGAVNGVLNIGSKISSKILSTEFGEKILGKAFGIIGKASGVDLLKIIGKKIPFLGTFVGLGLGVKDFIDGNIKSGLLNIASGLASCIPLAGIPLSLAIDTYNMLSSENNTESDAGSNMDTSLLGAGAHFISKILSSEWIMKTVFKVAGKTGVAGLKFIAKKIPLLGLLVGIGSAISEFKDGKIRSGLFELASGIASIFPGVGTIISMGIDGLNMWLNSKSDEKKEEKTEASNINGPGIWTKITDSLKSGTRWILQNMVPFIGPMIDKWIFDGKDPIDQIKDGLSILKEGYNQLSKMSWSDIFSTVKDFIISGAENTIRSIPLIGDKIANTIFGKKENSASLQVIPNQTINLNSLEKTQIVGARAFGGPIDKNKSYLVGEKGPEIVTPRSDGNVIPNHMINDFIGQLQPLMKVNKPESFNKWKEQYLSADNLSKQFDWKVGSFAFDTARAGSQQSPFFGTLFGGLVGGLIDQIRDIMDYKKFTKAKNDIGNAILGKNDDMKEMEEKYGGLFGGIKKAYDKHILNRKISNLQYDLNNPQTRANLTPEQIQQHQSQIGSYQQQLGNISSYEQQKSSNGSNTSQNASSTATPNSNKDYTDPNGTKDNNVGNIRAGKGFRTYQTPEAGVADAARLLGTDRYNGKSLYEIGKIWAPSSDGNNPGQWAEIIGKIAKLDPSQPLNMKDPDTVKKVISGIARMEKSKSVATRFTSDVISKGVDQHFNGGSPQQNTQNASTTVSPNGQSQIGSNPQLAQQNQASSAITPVSNEEIQQSKSETEGQPPSPADSLPKGDMDKSGFKAPGGANIDKVNPDFLSRFSAATADYNRQTGNVVQVTDGWRSYDSQVELKQRKGKLAATPGRSMHGYGFAIDANSKDLTSMDKMGLLSKYGLTRPMGYEPWHVEPIGVNKKELYASGPSGKQAGSYYSAALTGGKINNNQIANNDKQLPTGKDSGYENQDRLGINNSKKETDNMKLASNQTEQIPNNDETVPGGSGNPPINNILVSQGSNNTQPYQSQNDKDNNFNNMGDLDSIINSLFNSAGSTLQSKAKTYPYGSQMHQVLTATA